MCRFMLTLASFLACLGAAQAIPARLPYEPDERKTPPPSLVQLRDTVWEGKLFSGSCRIHFLPNGMLRYVQGDIPTRGSWRLDGVNLYFEINKYSEYKTVVQGKVIAGDGWNKAGQRCQTVLTRIQ